MTEKSNWLIATIKIPERQKSHNCDTKDIKSAIKQYFFSHFRKTKIT